MFKLVAIENIKSGDVCCMGMDGMEHEAPNKLTGCCNNFGKKCNKCGGFMHYQPVYGGYYYECEDCHEKE